MTTTRTYPEYPDYDLTVVHVPDVTVGPSLMKCKLCDCEMLPDRACATMEASAWVCHVCSRVVVVTWGAAT